MLRPAPSLPPWRLLTPCSASRLSPRRQGLLLSASALTQAGLPPAGPVQLCWTQHGVHSITVFKKCEHSQYVNTLANMPASTRGDAAEVRTSIAAGCKGSRPRAPLARARASGRGGRGARGCSGAVASRKSRWTSAGGGPQIPMAIRTPRSTRGPCRHAGDGEDTYRVCGHHRPGRGRVRCEPGAAG